MPLDALHYDRFDTPNDEAERQVVGELPHQSAGRHRTAVMSLDEAETTFTRKVQRKPQPAPASRSWTGD
jgi:hypothetical protein